MPTVIGQPLNRVDGRRKVTGAAPYAADHRFDGIVHAYGVMSTIAAGEILGLDTRAAEASPGAEDARIPHAALSTSGITGAGRVRLHSVFPSEFPTRDEDGRAHPYRGSGRLRLSVRDYPEPDVGRQATACNDSFSSILFDTCDLRSKQKTFCET